MPLTPEGEPLREVQVWFPFRGQGCVKPHIFNMLNALNGYGFRKTLQVFKDRL
jgi:hypothetical protein